MGGIKAVTHKTGGSIGSMVSLYTLKKKNMWPLTGIESVLQPASQSLHCPCDHAPKQKTQQTYLQGSITQQYCRSMKISEAQPLLMKDI
jgi:hypothetical protein